MIGVVIGTGSWDGLARETAAAAARMTGLRFTVIDTPWRDVPHPSWLKLWIPERVPGADAWLVMDADMVPLKPWDPRAWLARAPGCLLAARDRTAPCVERECAARGLRADSYANGGLLLFDRFGAEVLEAARQWFPRCGPWLEQSAVNKAMAAHPSRVRLLPRAVNLVTTAAEVLADPLPFRHAVNVHTVSLGGDLRAFRAARAALTGA